MTERKTQLDAIAVVILMACCLLWGLQQVLIKATIAELPPMFQASLRLIGDTLLLLLWCWWRGIALFEPDGSLPAGLLAGALFGAEFACIYLGLQSTSASRLTVFLSTPPFRVAALVPLWIKSETLRGVQWLGLLAAFMAVSFALQEGFTAGAYSLRGDLLGVAAGLFWGLTTVVIRVSGLARISAEKLLFYQLAVSAAAFPLLSLALGEVWTWQFSAFAIASLTVQTVVRRLHQLPRLHVAAGPLPGHQGLSLRVFHPAVRAAVRRALAQGKRHTGSAGGAGHRGRRHRADEPPARHTRSQAH